MTHIQAALEYVRNNRERFLEELKEFVAIPSISTTDEHKADVARAAEWVAGQLRSLGMTRVAVMPTGGHPVVYGEWMGAGKHAPTLMIYGHYDVQPVDPLELWECDPFEAVERGNYFVGRGVSDMKGQVQAALKAVEAIMRTNTFPVNLKWLVEGEEEVGSKNLEGFIKKNADLLQADICLNPDAGMMSADMPTITYGLRGLCYMELRVYGPDKDLHSGLYGGVIYNPAQALAELVAGMHDKKGRVTLPGFYDSVRRLTKRERADFARIPLTKKELLQQTGVSQLWGDPAFTPSERIGALPTLEVNGLLSGWTGKGSKTVLPSSAMAKISCRLVPDQTPEQVVKQMKAYLKAKSPKGIRWELEELTHSGWAITDVNSHSVKAMADALETVWGKRPIFRREGGSIGVVVHLQEYVGVESVLTGFGLPDDLIHSPNEHLHLPTWEKGIEALVRFIYNMK
jgi:acetylornithine deacetylase/succinyl-diaminopimelate desuccinylase-like protein